MFHYVHGGYRIAFFGINLQTRRYYSFFSLFDLLPRKDCGCVNSPRLRKLQCSIMYMGFLTQRSSSIAFFDINLQARRYHSFFSLFDLLPRKERCCINSPRLMKLQCPILYMGLPIAAFSFLLLFQKILQGNKLEI